MPTWKTVSTRRTFAFDIEARPGPWAGSDFTFRNMLSIAGCYADDRVMKYLAPGFTAGQLEDFVSPMREGALIVTHNGPRYDLPFLNGSLIKMGLAPLPRLLVSDTYAHFPKRGQAFSASLGNLAKRFGVEHQKGSMSEVDWDRAYSGDKDALEDLRLYNINDVLTTLDLRAKLMEIGVLRSPKMWCP
jgi:uncharacterized protein YprB with RNaseH-like and TPR domain